jgi:hypothetical protein
MVFLEFVETVTQQESTMVPHPVKSRITIAVLWCILDVERDITLF